MAQVKKEVFVWDFTFMNHLLRVHLGLSANEYIYMDMVARLANQHGGYTGLSNKSAAQAVGVSVSTIKKFIEGLTAKGLLEAKDSCIGDCVPKRGSVLWWELYNKLLPKNENLTTPQSNLNRGSQNLTTPIQKLTAPVQNSPTIVNPIVNLIDKNIKEKGEKEFSHPAPDFFSENSENPNTTTAKNLASEEKEKNCGKKEKDEEAKITIADINLLKGTFPFLQTVSQVMQDEFWAWLSVRMIKKATAPKFRIVKARLEQLNQLSLQYTAASIIKCLKDAQTGGKTGDGWVNPFAAEDKMIAKTQTIANPTNNTLANHKTDEQRKKEAIQVAIAKQAAEDKVRAEKEAAEHAKRKAEFERQQAAKSQPQQVKSEPQQQVRLEQQNPHLVTHLIAAIFENENAIPLQQLISKGFSFEYKDELDKANKAAILNKIYRFDEFAPQMANLLPESQRGEFIAKYITNKSKRADEASLFIGAIGFVSKPKLANAI